MTELNTKITYQYRDADNYKKWASVVIHGAIQLSAISKFLFEKEFFIPSEIGLEDLQKLPFKSCDHVWHELLSVSKVNEKPTHNIEADHLLQLLRQASKVEWNHVAVFKKKRGL